MRYLQNVCAYKTDGHVSPDCRKVRQVALTLQDEREKHTAKMDALRETHAAEMRRLTAEIDELHAQSGKLQQDSSEMHRANIRMHEELAQALTEREDVYRERVTPLQVRSLNASQAAHDRHVLRRLSGAQTFAVMLACVASEVVRAASETCVQVQKEVAEATAERDELRAAKAELEEQIQDVTEQLTRETEARVDCESELRRVKEALDCALQDNDGMKQRCDEQEERLNEQGHKSEYLTSTWAELKETNARCGRARAREERARAQDLPVRPAFCCAHSVALQRAVLVYVEWIECDERVTCQLVSMSTLLQSMAHSLASSSHLDLAACRLENTIRELQAGPRRSRTRRARSTPPRPRSCSA